MKTITGFIFLVTAAACAACATREPPTLPSHPEAQATAAQLGALVKLLLAALEPGFGAAPGAQRGVLQRASIAESERPGERPHGIHQTEVQGCLGGTLTAR